jgi:two-component system, OmpR family, sensor kinase
VGSVGREGRMGQRSAGEYLDERLLGTLERLLALDATNLHDALDHVTQLVADAMGADKVDVFLLEPTSSTLVARGTSDTPMGHLQKAIGMDKMPIVNGGRAVEVFQTGAPFVTGHADQDPSELIGITQGLGVRSTLAVALPLRSKGRGVLVVVSATPERFTERDLYFVEAISSWIGLVAHRAELVEQIAHEAHEEGHRRGAEELIAVVAHDLRNYLTPLKTRLELLQLRAKRQQRPADMEDTRAAIQVVNRLAQVITDVLDATRLGQGLFVLKPQAVDLAALARATAEALATPENSIEVRAPDEVEAIVDPDRVRQALENLLANALQHSPEQAPVHVEIAGAAESGESDRAGHIDIMVSDQGPGIALDALPHLFDRFISGPNSTGLGLGLYLARQIALAHGGNLTAESLPGKGSRFRLSLPVSPPQEATVNQRTDSEQTTDSE